MPIPLSPRFQSLWAFGEPEDLNPVLPYGTVHNAVHSLYAKRPELYGRITERYAGIANAWHWDITGTPGYGAIFLYYKYAKKLTPFIDKYDLRLQDGTNTILLKHLCVVRQRTILRDPISTSVYDLGDHSIVMLEIRDKTWRATWSPPGVETNFIARKVSTRVAFDTNPVIHREDTQPDPAEPYFFDPDTETPEPTLTYPLLFGNDETKYFREGLEKACDSTCELEIVGELPTLNPIENVDLETLSTWDAMHWISETLGFVIALQPEGLIRIYGDADTKTDPADPTHEDYALHLLDYDRDLGKTPYPANLRYYRRPATATVATEIYVEDADLEIAVPAPLTYTEETYTEEIELEPLLIDAEKQVEAGHSIPLTSVIHAGDTDFSAAEGLTAEAEERATALLRTLHNQVFDTFLFVGYLPFRLSRTYQSISHYDFGQGPRTEVFRAVPHKPFTQRHEFTASTPQRGPLRRIWSPSEVALTLDRNLAHRMFNQTHFGLVGIYPHPDDLAADPQVLKLEPDGYCWAKPLSEATYGSKALYRGPRTLHYPADATETTLLAIAVGWWNPRKGQWEVQVVGHAGTPIAIGVQTSEWADGSCEALLSASYNLHSDLGGVDDAGNVTITFMDATGLFAGTTNIDDTLYGISIDNSDAFMVIGANCP